MPLDDEVAFLCTPDSGGSAKAWRVVVKEAGQVWAPKSRCRLVKLTTEKEGWTHRLYVPRELAQKDAKLSAALARGADDKPSTPRAGAPRHAFETRTRADTGFGSGPTAERLYVERKMARLREYEAARLLGLAESVYQDLETGRRDFVHGDALSLAVTAFERERQRRASTRR